MIRSLPISGLAALAVVASASTGSAQAIDDGLMLPARQVRLGVEYGRDRWDRYWEGTLRRDNENIGTVTTRSTTVSAGYGLTSRVSLFATLPHVRTQASQGVLHGLRGWQDVTVAAKVRVLDGRVSSRARGSAMLLGAAAAPASDYTPDFLPLSIGLGARRATARGVVHLADRSGLFAEAAAGRTWRSTVHLDRPAYYTDGQLVLSDEVAMPDVADFATAVGFQRGRWCIPVMVVAQRTLGGSDIRRQDMPFVSNRMDFTRLQAKAMYTLPRLRAITVMAGAAHTLAGRNVGQGTTLSAGLTTAFRP
jgi:hypothetical protein